ncbi:MAG: CDP-diacylglycerol--serine O-phosphatidyltransferase [bacterium]|nr:CDP-diacylglycerol--serine O-phosphatidyltransferase [bacterium]MBK8130374.1 CDP-diacylglycerol--serine O-phosphatidyltransferase [bacterium]
MRNLANILTGLNLIFGFSSMLLAIDGHIQVAAWLIALAVVMDAFDGKAARFFGASSSFGLQFDSLADVVSMGVAPSILCYAAAFREDSLLGMGVCALPVLAAAFRLARFNVRTRTLGGGYEGLTSPLHACLVATFVLMNYALWDGIANVEWLAGLLVVTSFLMVSHLPLAGLPKFTLREPGRNLQRLLILAAAIGLAAINPPLFAFPLMVVLFALSAFYGQLQARRARDLEDDEEEEPQPLPTGWKKS